MWLAIKYPHLWLAFTNEYSIIQGYPSWNIIYMTPVALYSMIDGLDISSEITLRLLLLNRNNDKTTYIQIIPRRRQTTRHGVNQCWPRFKHISNIIYQIFIYTNERLVPICVTLLRNINCSFHPFFINSRHTNTWAVRKSTSRKRW